MTAPKLFISYSWTTPEHEQYVLDLATRLRSSGVDVMLDKWDLVKGADADAYMEKMVADPDIKKVLMVVDRAYAEKSDKRQRGVGTEAQIISRQVYEQQNEGKFVVLSVEADADGKPFRPTYYASRILIDLTDPSRYEEKFEEIQRWIFDRPLHVKPPLGPTPAFLKEGAAPRSPTSILLNKTYDALRNISSNAGGLLIEFFDEYLRGLEAFRIKSKEGEIDDAVVASIDASLPLQKDCISVIHAIARFAPDESYVDLLQRLLEGALAYYYPPKGATEWIDDKADGCRFIGHELLLSTLASLIQHGRFRSARALIVARYYIDPELSHRNIRIGPVYEFRVHLDTLERRVKRLDLRRVSLVADFMKARSENSAPNFRHLMQADLILFLHSHLHGKDHFDWWWPETLVYADMHHSAEIFARSESAAFFKNVELLLSVKSVEEFKEFVGQMLKGGPGVLPRFGHSFLPLRSLVNLDRLATHT